MIIAPWLIVSAAAADLTFTLDSEADSTSWTVHDIGRPGALPQSEVRGADGESFVVTSFVHGHGLGNLLLTVTVDVLDARGRAIGSRVVREDLKTRIEDVQPVTSAEGMPAFELRIVQSGSPAEWTWTGEPILLTSKTSGGVEQRVGPIPLEWLEMARGQERVDAELGVSSIACEGPRGWGGLVQLRGLYPPGVEVGEPYDSRRIVWILAGRNRRHRTSERAATLRCRKAFENGDVIDISLRIALAP